MMLEQGTSAARAKAPATSQRRRRLQCEMIARMDLTLRTGTSRRLGRPRNAMLILAAAASLAGCGVVAAPVRTTSAVVKVVPVAGDVVAAPLDVTANVID